MSAYLNSMMNVSNQSRFQNLERAGDAGDGDGERILMKLTEKP